MTIREMRERKRELRYTNEELAKLSGVPLSTVQKVFAGVTTEPRRKTMLALEKVLLARPFVSYEDFQMETPMHIREEAMAYNIQQQGRYTIYDYYALPEDRRVELIDGVFYDMAAPSIVHQLILAEMTFQLMSCEKEKALGSCIVVPAPYDVQLDKDIYTMVQPDILAFRGDPVESERCYSGAPAFVVEILSPSSRSRDMMLKLNKYEKAGVQEYWVVDPKYAKVIVYTLPGEVRLTQYSFHDRIPVGISSGACEVDFEVIFEKIKGFYNDKDEMQLSEPEEEPK